MESGRDEFHPQILHDAWFQALKDEDCVRVWDLLKDNNSLMNRGWNKETDPEAEHNVREVENGNLSPGSKGYVAPKPQQVWKGRTALHVAARRGDIELLQKIRLILHGEGQKCSTQCHVLEVIHSDYELDALAMTVLNGNRKIISLLIQIAGECTLNPDQQVSRKTYNGLAPPDGGENKAILKEDPNADKLELELKGLTKKVLQSPLSSSGVVQHLFREDCDFNFLQISLYLFHFTFSTWESNEGRDTDIRLIQEEIFLRARVEGLLKYLLLDLKDGQGRTPLHVAVDSNKVREFRKLLDKTQLDELKREVMNAKDSAGRTPLYQAAAKNQLVAVEELLKDGRVDITAEITYRADEWGPGLDLDKLSWKNGFKSDCVYVSKEKLSRIAFNEKGNAQGGWGPIIPPLEKVSSTALHVSIILKHEEIVRCIVDKLLETQKSSVECQRRFTWPGAAWDIISKYTAYDVSTMKLAILVGSKSIVQNLLKGEEGRPGLFTSKVDEKDFPSLHFAAAIGNLNVIKVFLDSEERYFYSKAVDKFQNTALHHAVKGKHVQVHPHLVDFVDCQHVLKWRKENDERISLWSTSEGISEGISEWLAKARDITQIQSVAEINDFAKDEDRDRQRMKSIDLLLGARINIWQTNVSNRRANPGLDASEEFVRWWNEKVAKAARDAHQGQKKLNGAANAILVTAALVATASYAGPLMPPLGYDGDSMQANISAVRVFVFCNGLAFYFSVVAIILALGASIPYPYESTSTAVTRTSALVIASVTFLSPSILCVLIAFAAAYIAAIPDHGLAHGGLAVATICVGVLPCLFFMILFERQLVKVLATLPIEVSEFINSSWFCGIKYSQLCPKQPIHN